MLSILRGGGGGGKFVEVVEFPPYDTQLACGPPAGVGSASADAIHGVKPKGVCVGVQIGLGELSFVSTFWAGSRVKGATW